MRAPSHEPVMLDQVLQYLSPCDEETYVDGTFGAGGYSRAILKAARCYVYAIDRDPAVRQTADALAAEFPGRFTLLEGNFGDMEQLLEAKGVEQVDGVVLDVGVSSMQIDQAERGFSFRQEGPLDMRMSKQGPSAADFVNESSEEQIANVLYEYGGEKKSRRVAKAIVEARQVEPLTTTKQLAEIVRSNVRMSRDGIDPATRTFQAIRIWVNDELQELQRALEATKTLLRPNGRLVVVSFHSLEDGIVKHFLKEQSGQTEGVSRHSPLLESRQGEKKVAFRVLNKRPALPIDAEIARNVRSRSAKLRAALRIGNEGVAA